MGTGHRIVLSFCAGLEDDDCMKEMKIAVGRYIAMLRLPYIPGAFGSGLLRLDQFKSSH